MIPYIREKFAEKRAKWLAARGKRSTTSTTTTAATEEKDTLVEELATTTNTINATNTTTTTTTVAMVTTTTTGATNTPETSTTFPKVTATCSAAAGGRRPLSAGNRMMALQAQQHQQQQPRTTAGGLMPNNSSSGSNNSTPPTQRQTTKLNKTRRCSTSSSSNSNTSPNNSAGGSKDLINLQPPNERIKLRIICPSGRVLVFQTDTNKNLVELKNELILELADDPTSLPLFATDIRQLSPRYRLFRAEYQGVELNEAVSISQMNINNLDTLMLVPRRNHMQHMAAQTRENPAPRQQDIEVATRGIPARLVDMPMVDINEIFQQSNLQFDVRKVLISLAQASAIIIGAGPYASRLITMLKQKLINKRNYQNDTLQCLIDMGFKKEKAEYALKIHQGVYSAALEFLILHQSEEMPMEEAAMSLQKSQSLMSPSTIMANQTQGIMDNTEALLEIVRIYSHRDMPPSQETVNALTEMGFEEADVLEALKKTCNNKAAACEWLCGNRSGSLIELRDGLSQDSPILKSILELPQVQMNLSNPKILLAFLFILENENTIRVWGGDNDTTSVITHILQKYHEEKHVMGINQFYSNR